MERVNGLFILDPAAFDVVYRPNAAAEIAERVNVLGPPQTRFTIEARSELLADVDVIFGGWGMPKIDDAFLNRAPNLRAVFYGAGAINGWCTPAVWARGICVTSANDANAIPVAEYTVATAIFSLKQGWQLSGCESKRLQGFRIRRDVPGNYKSTLGLVGMGTVARLIVDLIKPFGMRVVTHDPYLPADEAARLGVANVPLDELFSQSDVVSLHAPDLPTTRGMIGSAQLSLMKPNATFINTSRGRVVREGELIDALTARPDLHAVLDVTETEPLPATSRLCTLPNITLTPHLAGSQGRECQRMGDYMVEELDRYLAGEPLKWQVRPDGLAHSVHALPTVTTATTPRLVRA